MIWNQVYTILKNNSLNIIIALFCLSFLACNADIYVPTPHQTHLLEEKGDMRIAGNTGDNGSNLQAAYALSDVIGISIYGTYMNKEGNALISSSESNSEHFQNHKYLEGALVINPYNNDRSHIEFILGYGEGEGEERNETVIDNKIREIYGYGRYSKYSALTNLAFKKGDFQVGISPKISYIDFGEVILTGYQVFESDSKEEWFLERSFFLRFGMDAMKFEFQIGSAQALKEVGFSYDPGYYSLGVQFSFNTQRN